MHPAYEQPVDYEKCELLDWPGGVRMTLGQFIEEMKKGWGFVRPWRVMAIGQALDRVVPEELRSIRVLVKYCRGSYGWGPDFRYTYRWAVKGVQLPAVGGRLSPSITDCVFGYRVENLPFLTLCEDGFVVGYDW